MCLHGNYYDKTPAGEWGIESHLDKGLITILMQDDTGGLEVQYKDTWYPLTPIKGSLIINLGRMLEYFTYGVAKGKFSHLQFQKVICLNIDLKEMVKKICRLGKQNLF